jgi:uncharacterized membrane protein
MTSRRHTIIGRSSAIGASITYALASVLAKRGLTGLAPPLVGAAVSLLSGTVVTGLCAGGGPWRNLRENRESVMFFLMSGAAAGIGILSAFFALSLAPVVIVSPLVNTSPLFSLLLSHLFLGGLERITLRLLLGAILVILGTALIAVGRVTH